jgi:hypothetical protein
MDRTPNPAIVLLTAIASIQQRYGYYNSDLACSGFSHGELSGNFQVRP